MTMRRLMLNALAFGCCALLVTDALAQPGGGRRPGGFGGPGMMGGGGAGMSRSMLLGSEKVQTELKLTDEQKEKLKEAGEAIRERMRDQFAGMRDPDLSREERMKMFEQAREKMQEIGKEMQTKVDEILTDEQSRRLKQISVQLGGQRMLLSEDVAGDLKLTDSQKEKIEEAFDAERESMRGLFEDLRAGDVKREEMAELREAFQAKTKMTIEGVLTDAQKEEWESLQGEKFDIDRRELFQRGGRGRGGEGGRPERGPRGEGGRPERGPRGEGGERPRRGPRGNGDV